METSAAVPVELQGEVLVVRPMRPEDRYQIQALWLHSYKSISKTNSSVYDKHQPALIARLMDECGVTVVCSGNLDTAILGWACGVMLGPLHYAYVPHELRNMGIARMAITSALAGYPEKIYVTHKFHGRINSHRFTHNPYLIGMVS